MGELKTQRLTYRLCKKKEKKKSLCRTEAVDKWGSIDWWGGGRVGWWLGGMERGGDEGRRATAHNVSSVAGGGPAMMWHCSEPPHVFFGPLCLLLHPSHAAPPWDGPSPSPHPPPTSSSYGPPTHATRN